MPLPRCGNSPTSGSWETREFRLEFPAAVGGSGNGGPYYYNLRRADTGESLSNNSTTLPGVSFDPYGRILRGWLLTLGLTPDIDEQMAPAIHHLEYVVHDGDGNCSPEDSAVTPFTITASERWSQIHIEPKYPWVAEDEDAVFVVMGQYAFNAPTVTLEITTTGDQGAQTRRDTIFIPVTATEDASVEYAVPTTDVDAVTVTLAPKELELWSSIYAPSDGYAVSSQSSLNRATVKVVDDFVRHDVIVVGPTFEASPGDTIVLRGWYTVDPPYESGTNELAYHEWAQTGGLPAIQQDGFPRSFRDHPRRRLSRRTPGLRADGEGQDGGFHRHGHGHGHGEDRSRACQPPAEEAPAAPRLMPAPT